MDFKESERFQNNSYPKLKQLLDAKTALINKRASPALSLTVNSFQDFDFMDLISDQVKYDVILMRLPVPQTIVHWEDGHQGGQKKSGGSPFTSIDHILNIFRIDLLSESPSLVLLGCRSSVKGLQLGRKLLSQLGYRRAEDIVWVH